MTLNERTQVEARKFAKEHFGGKPDEGDYNLILSAMCIGADLALNYVRTEVMDVQSFIPPRGREDLLPPGVREHTNDLGNHISEES